MFSGYGAAFGGRRGRAGGRTGWSAGFCVSPGSAGPGLGVARWGRRSGRPGLAGEGGWIRGGRAWGPRLTCSAAAWARAGLGGSRGGAGAVAGNLRVCLCECVSVCVSCRFFFFFLQFCGACEVRPHSRCGACGGASRPRVGMAAVGVRSPRGMGARHRGEGSAGRPAGAGPRARPVLRRLPGRLWAAILRKSDRGLADPRSPYISAPLFKCCPWEWRLLRSSGHRTAPGVDGAESLVPGPPGDQP